MKFLCVVSLSVLATLTAAQETSPKPPRPAGAQKAATVAAGKNGARPSRTPEGVPADAVKISELEWRHTDREGKSWIYKKTPFSIAKLPAPADGQPEPLPPPAMEARDLGDTVEFSRQTPFGVARWTKKKGELDESERSALEAAQRAVLRRKE